MSFIVRLLVLGACMVAAVWTLRGLLRDLADQAQEEPEPKGLDVEIAGAAMAMAVGPDREPPHPEFEKAYQMGVHEGLRQAAHSLVDTYAEAI